MKTRIVLWSLATVALLASCSKENVMNAVTESEETTYAATVKLVLPIVNSTETKAATDPSFEDGADYEHVVDNNKVYFEFFDADYVRMNIISGQQITWTTDGSSTDNITKVGTLTLKANRKPTYMVVFVNANNTVYSQINTLSLENLKKAIDPAPGANPMARRSFITDNVANSAGFVMTNSSFYNAGGVRTQEVKISDNIYKVGDTPKEAVSVHVERVVAKTTVNITASASGTSSDPYYVIYDSSSNPLYGVKFLGWCLNATNKTIVSLKSIPATQWSYEGWAGNVVWNNAAYGRSYWAEDGNYATGTGNYLSNSGFEGRQIKVGESTLSLNYYTLNQITNPLGTTPEYCYENTSTPDLYNNYGSVTHVLLKAKYVTKTGADVTGDVYRLNKTIYTDGELKAWIKNEMETAFPSATFAVSDFTVVRDQMNYNERSDVKGTVKYTGSESLGTLDPNNLNPHLFGQATLWVYPDGICYYSTPIKHFSDVAKTITGHYGVVRNHWYQVNVSAVNGFGHPADPDKPIVPEGIEDEEWQLRCTINVLSWAIKTQNATVGGDDIWN